MLAIFVENKVGGLWHMIKSFEIC